RAARCMANAPAASSVSRQAIAISRIFLCLGLMVIPRRARHREGRARRSLPAIITEYSATTARQQFSGLAAAAWQPMRSRQACPRLQADVLGQAPIVYPPKQQKTRKALADAGLLVSLDALGHPTGGEGGIRTHGTGLPYA